MSAVGLSLASIVQSAGSLPEVRKSDLHFGDWVIVKTVKSTYRIRALGGDMYRVTGGWFEKKGLPPMELRISGCTWGGSTIKTDVIAACGLSIEFGNRVITSPIRKIIVLPVHTQN